MAAPRELPLEARRAAWDALWQILLAPHPGGHSGSPDPADAKVPTRTESEAARRNRHCAAMRPPTLRPARRTGGTRSVHGRYWPCALGLPVFPSTRWIGAGRCSCGKHCGRNAGKHPRTHNGLLDATLDPAASSLVAALAGRQCRGRHGCSRGHLGPRRRSRHHGGLESIERLEAAHGELPQTWCVETGGDGLHLWFCLG